MKKLSLQYLVFLGVLTLAIVSSQVLIQRTIAESKTDSRIINISGRQRMLSQRITKLAWQLRYCNTEAEFGKIKSELRASTNLWEESHESLKHGSQELDVSEMNSSASLVRLFQRIEPSFLAIRSALFEIFSIGYGSDLETLDMHIDLITKNEGEFLSIMNDITFEYDRLAAEKVEQLSFSEYLLLMIALALIILEALYIFRPMFKTASRKEDQIEDLHQYVQQSIRVIGSNERDKKQARQLIDNANKKVNDLQLKKKELEEALSSMERSLMLKEGSHFEKLSRMMDENEHFKNKINLLEKEVTRLKVAN